jgi:hypothetical protein
LNIEVDPCLCVHAEKGIVCLVYVDDCPLLFGKNKDTINEVVKVLEKDLPLTREDSVTEFLCIDIQEPSQGAYNLTQPRLIERVIEALGLKKVNTVDTSALSNPLVTNLEGAPFKEEWACTVVGMLMYLANNTHPDIAFAVHQCARFTQCPKESHSQAIKDIGRYLLGTKNKGLKVRPSKELRVDCCWDADFAGLFGTEDHQDPVCAKSHT